MGSTFGEIVLYYCSWFKKKEFFLPKYVDFYYRNLFLFIKS